MLTPFESSSSNKREASFLPCRAPLNCAEGDLAVRLEMICKLSEVCAADSGLWNGIWAAPQIEQGHNVICNEAQLYQVSSSEILL